MTSQDSPAPADPPVQPSSSPAPQAPTAGPGVAIPMAVLGLALLAGAAAWLVGESTLDSFHTSKAAENYQRPEILNQEMPRVSSLNGAVGFGPFGALLGLAMGLAGGLARRSLGGAVLGAVAGLILGTAAGVLPSFAVMPWHWAHRNDDPSSTELMVPLMVHLCLWSGIGLAAGLAFGIGGSGFQPARLIEAAFVGLVGAVLGTFIFEIGGAFLFPLARTASPFSVTPETRLLARLCVAGCVGLVALWALPPQPARQGTQPG
ncbi:MAG TPA: hypothetical protein VFF52_04445 [Isosphaeraceae bacterium]|nr:hypothetical protein [Isosphaeraceae bacterium]